MVRPSVYNKKQVRSTCLIVSIFAYDTLCITYMVVFLHYFAIVCKHLCQPSAMIEDSARLDIAANGLWEGRYDHCFSFILVFCVMILIQFSAFRSNAMLFCDYNWGSRGILLGLRGTVAWLCAMEMTGEFQLSSAYIYV